MTATPLLAIRQRWAGTDAIRNVFASAKGLP